MSTIVIWAVIAGAALVTEMLTGTLYLLVVGLAAALACALAALGVAGTAFQVAVFAAACIAGFVLLRSRKQETIQASPSDVGARVQVLWARDDGIYRVWHRGAEWDAFVSDDAQTDKPEWLEVIGIKGTRLHCKRS